MVKCISKIFGCFAALFMILVILIFTLTYTSVIPEEFSTSGAEVWVILVCLFLAVFFTVGSCTFSENNGLHENQGRHSLDSSDEE